MSIRVRVEFTPQEAEILVDEITRWMPGRENPVWGPLAKILRASEDPVGMVNLIDRQPKAGAWCVNKDVTCGEPDGEGLAGFCGRECWERAGRPNPSPLHPIELGGEA